MSSLAAGGAPVSVVPNRMTVGANGIEGFFWPVARQEQVAVANAFERGALDLLSSPLEQGDLDAEAIRILLYAIARDVSEFYLVTAVNNRCDAAGRSLNLSEHGRSYAYQQAQQPNQIASLTSQSLVDLRAGVVGPPRWLLPARAVRNLFNPDVFSHRRLKHVDVSKEVLSIASSTLTRRDAQRVEAETGRPVVLVSRWEWFVLSPGERRAAGELGPAGCKIVDQIVDAIVHAFAAGGEEAGKPVTAYFSEWIAEAVARVRFYLERLLRQPEALPATWWYGGGSAIWTRILRTAIRRTGGRLVSHDHGRGIGVYPCAGEHGIVFDLCDSFVTFSPALVEEYERFRSEIALRMTRGPGPEFDSVPPATQNPWSGRTSVEADRGTGNRVMYVSQAHLSDRISSTNFLPSTPVLVDWQCRLLSGLRELGYDVLFKPHPESDCAPPAGFVGELGAELLTGRAEDLLDLADIFLVDFLATVFVALVCTDKPIVFIDFGFGNPSASMHAILERRCAIVEGYFDESNRATVDWGAVRTAFCAAEERRHDRSAAQLLYGYPA